MPHTRDPGVALFYLHSHTLSKDQRCARNSSSHQNFSHEPPKTPMLSLGHQFNLLLPPCWVSLWTPWNSFLPKDLSWGNINPSERLWQKQAERERGGGLFPFPPGMFLGPWTGNLQCILRDASCGHGVRPPCSYHSYSRTVVTYLPYICIMNRVLVKCLGKGDFPCLPKEQVMPGHFIQVKKERKRAKRRCEVSSLVEHNCPCPESHQQGSPYT